MNEQATKKRLDEIFDAIFEKPRMTNEPIPTSSNETQKAPRAAVNNALAMLESLAAVSVTEDGKQLIQVPWPVTQRPQLDADVWIDSTVQDIAIRDLVATQPYLDRSRVADFVRNPGAIEAGRRALANVYDNGQMLIVDGHHRLAAWWLLGADRANVWYLVES